MEDNQADEGEKPRPSDARRIWTISIISSIVASAIVLVFFQPILEFLSRGLSAFLSYAAVGILDSMYQQAALGVERAIALTTFGMLMSAFMGVSTAPIVFLVIKSRISKVPAARRKLRKISEKINILQIFLGTFPIILIGIYFISSSFIGVQATASYENRLAVLAPTISEEEEESLRSEWSSMQSRADYVDLMVRMENLAAQKGRALPDRLI